VHAAASPAHLGDLLPVRIVGVEPNSLEGEVMAAPAEAVA
jgi:hypothetical protein